MLRESQNEQNKLQKQSLLEKAGIPGQFRTVIDRDTNEMGPWIPER